MYHHIPGIYLIHREGDIPLDFQSTVYIINIDIKFFISIPNYPTIPSRVTLDGIPHHQIFIYKKIKNIWYISTIGRYTHHLSVMVMG